MAITINGFLVLNEVTRRQRSVVVQDGRRLNRLTITAYTLSVPYVSTLWTTAKNLARQLEEMASNRAYRVWHLADDQIATDNGLYLVEGCETGAVLETPLNGRIEVNLTLLRLGGSPLGGNIVQRLQAQHSLQANNYSITSTPRIALPVGGTEIDVAAAATRASADGTMRLVSAAAVYAFTGADYLKGECRIWDTTGSAAEADWLRVWSPDHTFAAAHHVVIENGLLRIMGITGGNNGSHRYFVWTGAAWTEIASSTGGDGLFVDGSTVTATYTRILIQDLTPWRVQVAFRLIHTTPLTKTITLERGKPLALVTLVTTSSVALVIGMVGAGRWVFTKGSPLDGSSDMQRPAFDDTEEAGDVFLIAPEDNWVASFTTKSSTVGVLALGAWRSSGLSYVAREGGGFYISQTGTGLNVYLGGVKYDTSSAQVEAEAGTLTGGADLVSTVAGASGAGNDQVRLDAAGAQVDMTTNLASIGGSTVLILFRIAIIGVGFPSSLSLIIRNTTAGSNLASVSRDETHFAAESTWYWQSVVGSGWNGTDTLVARANAVVATATETYYIDQCIPIVIAGSTTTMKIDDMAAEALTETIVYPDLIQAVMT